MNRRHFLRRCNRRFLGQCTSGQGTVICSNGTYVDRVCVRMTAAVATKRSSLFRFSSLCGRRRPVGVIHNPTASCEWSMCAAGPQSPGSSQHPRREDRVLPALASLIVILLLTLLSNSVGGKPLLFVYVSIAKYIIVFWTLC